MSRTAYMLFTRTHSPDWVGINSYWELRVLASLLISGDY